MIIINFNLWVIFFERVFWFPQIALLTATRRPVLTVAESFVWVNFLRTFLGNANRRCWMRRDAMFCLIIQKWIYSYIYKYKFIHLSIYSYRSYALSDNLHNRYIVVIILSSQYNNSSKSNYPIIPSSIRYIWLKLTTKVSLGNKFSDITEALYKQNGVGTIAQECLSIHWRQCIHIEIYKAIYIFRERERKIDR